MTRFSGTQNAPIREGDFAVRAAANTDVVTKSPVVEIVLALITGFGVSGSFILLITRCG
ncbi:Uncharacterised protein [Shigella sonnei]|nr:Uncharacterised protein [Shigella sonnei]